MVQAGRYSSSTFFTLKTQRLQHLTPYLQSTLAYEPRGAMGQILSHITANEKMVKALGSLPRYHSNGTRTVITADYDYMGRRAWKKVESITPNPEMGEETTTVTLHHRYIYRGYLQIATCDLTRAAHPCLWLITWDPSQQVATRPLAIQKDGTWYCYGWDLTKNICEIYSTTGYIRTVYTYTPYGEVTASGSVTQPIQWSSEYADTELGLVYYNYRYYNPTDGRWTRFEPSDYLKGMNLYSYLEGKNTFFFDSLGLEAHGGFAFNWGYELGFFMDRAGGRDHPNVTAGETGEDLLSHLEKLSQENCCIKDFRIAGHGWNSHNDGIPSSSPDEENGFVLDKEDQDSHSTFGEGVADVKDLSDRITSGTIRFCKKCTISIYACRISDAFIEGLARATGCTVTASGGACRKNPSGAGWETNADKEGDTNQFRKSEGGKAATNAGVSPHHT